jgi:uncharacterized delta-60 repeat protein
MSQPAAVIKPGELDPTFGQGGRIDLMHTGEQATVAWLLPLSTGSLRVLSQRQEQQGFEVSQFTEQGQLDAGFAQGAGFFHQPFAEPGQFERLHAEPGGGFTVTGALENHLVAARYHADGTPDERFGLRGQVRIDIAELASAAPLAGQGRAQLSGTLGSIRHGSRLFLASTVRWAYDQLLSVVVCLDAQGRPDLTFNGTGHGFVTLAGQALPWNLFYDIGVQTQGAEAGKLLLAAKQVPPGEYGDCLVMRFNVDGTPDYRFGDPHDPASQGLLWLKDADVHSIRTLLVDPVDAFKVVGYRIVPGAGVDAVIQGCTAQGQPDPAFNGGALLTHELAQDWGIWYSAASRGASAGYQLVVSSQYRTTGLAYAARLLGDGRFDLAFGAQGLVQLPFQPTDALRHGRVGLAMNGDLLLGSGQVVYRLKG